MKKKITFLFLSCLLALLPARTLADAVAYAQYDEATKTLTFRYGDFTPDGKTSWDVGDTRFNYNTLAWKDYSTSITKVVFDTSFSEARPTDCNWWFYNCGNLTTIVGMENLNTSEVTGMALMFMGCSSLTSLDVSHFNTEKVTSMNTMFAGCRKLTSLDVSNFNTENVTNMTQMFNVCSSLTSLDLSNFNTEKVTTMASMFFACTSLASLNLSSFNTEKVTNMYCMFQSCRALTSLDLSSFNTGNVTIMSQMFNGCSGLTTIYCNGTWTADKSDNMFNNCTSLKGAVAYDASKVDASMANPETGYFTRKIPDGIQAVGAGEAGNAPWYDLNGRRLQGAPTQQGVYIHGGRKVWVR